MSAEPFLRRLLERAPALLGLSTAGDIVVHACNEARDLVGAGSVLVAYAPPPTPWERGRHLVVREQARPAEAATRSALFAVHRRLVSTREPIVLRRSPENETILNAFAAATCEPGASLDEAYAVPLLHHRTRRLIGEMAFVGATPAACESAHPALEHLVALTSTALENGHRLALARRDQDRLLLLAETTEEALYDWHVETGEVWWGGGIQKLLRSSAGLPSSRIEWKHGRVHPDDAGRVSSTLDAVLTSMRVSWTEQYRFQRADGSWARVEDRGHVLREASGRAYRVLGALRDVTELQERGEALRRNEEQLRNALVASDVANRAKDEFLAMLGHELRNPLAPMVVALEVLRLRGAQSRETQVLERQVKHLTRLVDDLLDVSRITRGKVALQLAPVELAHVVMRAVEIATPLLEQRGQKLRVDVPDGLLVRADMARLAQVISNLLTNAAKYSDPSSRIDVVAAEDSGRVRLSVVDRGAGIAPDMIDRIFDLFVQQPQTIDRSQGGLGLGLAIVKSLVEMHGGTVSVSSDGVGKGSTFTIELEACRVQSDDVAARSAPGRLPPRTDCGRRILVVDDNPDAAEMLGEMLQMLGQEVAIAHDGPEALAIAERFRPMIALLDIGLPVMDGYELATLLRSQTWAGDLRLVAITGYGQDRDRRRSHTAGFHAHLVKPIDLEQLTSAIGPEPAAVS